MAKALSLAETMAKTFGGNDAAMGPACWLSTGFLPLDKAVSGRYHTGGLPGGRMVEIFGPPAAGKTVLAINVMKEAQAAGGFAFFHDHERTLQEKLAVAQGMSTDPGKYLYKRPRSFEESVTLAIEIASTIRSGSFIDPKAPIVGVFDSLASMVPMSKLDKAATKFNMNDTTALARATSSSFPALAQLGEEMNLMLVFLNQIRTKPGVSFGDPTTTPGGSAPEFYMSVRISLTGGQIAQKDGDEKEITGKLIKATVKKNKVHRPFETATMRFMFQPDGSGAIDIVASSIEALCDLGLLVKEPSGMIVWLDGKKFYLKALAQKINAEGLLPQLLALFPTGSPIATT